MFKWKQNSVTYEASGLEEYGLLKTLSSIITIVVICIIIFVVIIRPSNGRVTPLEES
jgi:hypothetical protein